MFLIRIFWSSKSFFYAVIAICGYKFLVNLDNIYLHPSNSSIEEHVQENLARLEFLHKFFMNFSFSNPSNPDTVIVIISSRRNYGSVYLDYPFQTIGKLLFEMKPHEKNIGIFICNTTENLHSAESSLDNVIGSPHIYKFSNILTQDDKQGRWYRELLDYISCLNETQRRYPNTKYFIVNEDDGLIVNGFYDNLNKVLSQVNFLTIQNTGKKKISHIKLFHPLDLRKIPFIIYLITVPLSFASLIKMISIYSSFPVSKLFLLTIFLITFSFLFGIGANSVGILHYKMTGSIALVNQESCCLVSVIFPSNTLGATIRYLVEESKIGIKTGIYRAKDTILDDLPLKTDMDVLMTEFNLVEHIGRFSTKSV